MNARTLTVFRLYQFFNGIIFTGPIWAVFLLSRGLSLTQFGFVLAPAVLALLVENRIGNALLGPSGSVGPSLAALSPPLRGGTAHPMRGLDGVSPHHQRPLSLGSVA